MNLRKLRVMRGMSLQDVANRAGLSVATVWLIENGRLSPTLRTLRTLAASFNMSLERFLKEAEADGKASVKSSD